jgi:hypothetical protein
MFDAGPTYGSNSYRCRPDITELIRSVPSYQVDAGKTHQIEESL